MLGVMTLAVLVGSRVCGSPSTTAQVTLSTLFVAAGSWSVMVDEVTAAKLAAFCRGVQAAVPTTSAPARAAVRAARVTRDRICRVPEDVTGSPLISRP